MKFSKDTFTVLKNFASINDGIVFRKGNTLRTCDASKQVLAETTINEDIPSDFAIFDLNRFLSVLSLHDDNTDIELDSTAKSAYLKSNRKKTEYRLCDLSMVKNAPEKSINMPAPDVTFTLTAEDLEATLRSAAVLGAPHIAVKSDGEKIYVAQLDNKNTSAHTSQTEIADGNGKKYTMLFKAENMKMIPGTYDVSISFKGIANFKNKEKNLQYWVATEIGSTGEA